MSVCVTEMLDVPEIRLSWWLEGKFSFNIHIQGNEEEEEDEEEEKRPD